VYIYGIAIKYEQRKPMREVVQVEITVESGLKGDVFGRGSLLHNNRQVTVLSLQQWQDACTEIGTELPWHVRRAGLCIDGVTFGSQDVGKQLSIGDNVILKITGETVPCPRMDEIFMGLMDSLKPDWRGGVNCRVIQGGIIKKDSSVSFL